MSAITPPQPTSAGGFTLLEVLVTLALIGLITSVLVIGTNRLLGDQTKSPTELLWDAVNQTRREALLNNQEARLTLDKRTNEFVFTLAGTEQRFAFVAKEIAELDFLAPTSGAAILVAGEVVETQTISHVTFYGDGTCSPFRVQIKTPTGARVITVDPWTCAPMLDAKAEL